MLKCAVEQKFWKNTALDFSYEFEWLVFYTEEHLRLIILDFNKHDLSFYYYLFLH